MRKEILSVCTIALLGLIGFAFTWSAETPREKERLPPCCVECACGCNETGVCDCFKVSDDDKCDPLEGIYTVKGKDKVMSYTGVAIIRKSGEQQYIMQTATSSLNEEGKPVSGSEYLCVGMREGNVISFAYKVGQQKSGLTVYKIEGKGVLCGRFTVFPQNTDVYTETLKKIAPLPKPCCEETIARQSFTALVTPRKDRAGEAQSVAEEAQAVADVPNLRGEWLQAGESPELCASYFIHQCGRFFSIELEGKYVGWGEIRADDTLMIRFSDGLLGTYRLICDGTIFTGLTSVIPDISLNDNGMIDCGFPERYNRR